MNPHRFDYLRDPEEIYRSSFATIRRETDLSGVPDDLVGIRLLAGAGGSNCSVPLGLCLGHRRLTPGLGDLRFSQSFYVTRCIREIFQRER